MMRTMAGVLGACSAAAVFWLSAGAPAVAEEPAAPKIRFTKTQLDPTFRSEGVAVADFNGDGKLDVAAGSVYYAAPDWKMVSILDEPQEYDPKGYAPTFCNFADDLNGDGWVDLIVVDFPGQHTWWFENPGEKGGPWKRHVLTQVTNNESPLYVDIDGDGQRELICAINSDPKDPDGPQRRMAIVRRTDDPYAEWKIQTVSAAAAPSTTKYSHGLGVGDINGDGRNDIVVPQGWWEAPEDPQAEEWKFHSAPLGEPASHMIVYDFNGDGRADVLSASAHDYGIWLHEQTDEGWKTRTIDDSFSQTHAVCFADIDGDGVPDIVTGKRYWAHGPQGDRGAGEPAVMFWYHTTQEDGKAVFTPHQFDHDSGVGTQFEVIDLNGDGLLDVVTSNKKGTHIHIQSRD